MPENKPMTNEDLSQIEARAAAASPGPWTLGAPEGPMDGPTVKDADGLTLVEDVSIRITECDFIAHARTDVPALVSEVRRLRALFTAEDIELLEGEADHFYRDTEDRMKDGLTASEQLLALAARIRQAIGEPPPL